MGRINFRVVALVSAVLFVSPYALRAADGVPELLTTLKDTHAEGTDLWIYNDIAAAMAEGRKQNKPIFVTFRCVPCKACASFDAEVAQGSERVEDLAREKFIPVRQVEMKGVDLSLFQFDHDLNWAAMFINADGVVYARYGTQSAEGPDAYNSIEGLVRTMYRVLELHEDYPANADSLRGKRAAEKPYRTALEMPGLENKERFEGPTQRGNCIHCHNIHDAENNDAQDTGTFTQDMLWRYPLPDNAGVVIDPVSGVRVKQVVAGSPAEQAGLEAGEDIVSMQGQPITSIADMQWVLDNLPASDAQLTVEGSKTGSHTLALASGWKKWDVSWRASLHSIRPRLRVWMPPLDVEKRASLGIPDSQTPLEVRWINRGQPGGRSAYDAGLREGDVVVALAGEAMNMTPQQLNLHIKLNYRIGDELPLTVLRDGKEQDVKIKLVE